jgi:transposase
MSPKKGHSKKVNLKIRERRNFSEALKRQIVLDLESKVTRIQESCELYNVDRTSIYRWLYKYSLHHKKGMIQVVQMESEAEKSKQLYSRVKELEAVVGRKQLEIHYLDRLIDLASDELEYDFKKKIRTTTIEWFREHKEEHDHSLRKLLSYSRISRQGHQQALLRIREGEGKEKRRLFCI